VLITGRDKGKKREELVGRLKSGETPIAIGTHALFQDDVMFDDLALVVVDEQHRFGVHQRLALAGKGAAADILVMTATPIPRTLMMTAYGDLETSRLTEKPAGRKPIETRAMPLSRLEEIVDRISPAIASGARIYWVCPLVEDSDVVDVAAATERHAALAQRFGDRVGLVHGRLKAAEKDSVMALFADGDLDILVATTVIEVGVDVPEATIMVIEQAERFGLAQLHQLRGRVGRGDRPSSCILLYAEPLGETAKARLKVMRETDDGFVIAEEDLRLRGAGEVLGTKQSGLPQFRMADLAAHADLIRAARDDALVILEKDPELKSERGEALRTLLYLFERDAVVKTALSG
ncbi:MAG: ATP-dependent DNA helicase RecG, partial [Alphaproteobacteria bacterium]|nr:ATP-dependent DNA helicase RecG [Alphaproteobacteria bacterium]